MTQVMPSIVQWKQHCLRLQSLSSLSDQSWHLYRAGHFRKHCICYTPRGSSVQLIACYLGSVVIKAIYRWISVTFGLAAVMVFAAFGFGDYLLIVQWNCYRPAVPNIALTTLCDQHSGLQMTQYIVRTLYTHTSTTAFNHHAFRSV